MDFLKNHLRFVEQADFKNFQNFTLLEWAMWVLLLANTLCFIFNCIVGSFVLLISLAAMVMMVYNLNQFYDDRARNKA